MRTGSPRIPRRAAVALGAALTAGFAMAFPGSIEFRLADAGTRAPIVGAEVELSSGGPAGTRRALSDRDGRAVFSEVPSGVFAARIRAAGYATLELPEVRVTSGATGVVPVLLIPAREERVIVADQRPVVQLEGHAVESRFEDSFIEQLPVPGRFFQNLLTLAPGVLDANGDGNPNVHGARERDFKTVVSGVSNQDPLTGKWLGQVSIDSIEAMEVITAGAGAEFGRAQGGFANVVQRQGGDAFEGTFSAIVRSSRLDGNGATNAPDESIPEFSWFQPSVQLSGPIVRGRLWFRATHEYQDIDRPVDLVGRVAVTNHRQWIHDDQLTWQVSPRNTLALRFHHDPYRDTNVGLSTLRPPESTWTERFGGPTWSLSWTAPASARWLVETQAAYQDYTLEQEPTTSHLWNDCIVGPEALMQAQCENADVGRTTGSFPESRTDYRQRLTVQSKATWFAGSVGRSTHTVRFGGSIENERYEREVERRPRMSFHSIQPDPVEFNGRIYVPPRVGFATTTFTLPFHARDGVDGTSWALWAQDEIRIGASLSLTLGLRYDVEAFEVLGYSAFDPAAETREYLAQRTGDVVVDSLLMRDVFTAVDAGDEGRGSITQQLATVLGYEPPLAPNAVQSLFWMRSRQPEAFRRTNRNWAPRLALSWDPTADGKTRLSATAGRYYDKIFLAVPLIERDPTSTTILFRTEEWEGNYYWTWHTYVLPVNPGLDAHVVDRNLATPYQDELTASVERELPIPETSLRLTWIRRRFEDQLQDQDINRLPGDLGRCVAQLLPSLPSVVESPGSGIELTDPYSGERYVDTDPGAGDGRTDDCGGTALVVYNIFYRDFGIVQHPDGRADLYVQNPAWGSIYRVGNTNEARYTALQLELRRRRWNGWEAAFGYTFSRGVGQAEDYRQVLGNDRSLLADEQGYLAYDQRHVVKLQAAGDLRGGLRLGAAVTWQSGLPYSIIVSRPSYDAAPPYFGNLAAPEPKVRYVYPTGQRNDQRNPGTWNVDVRLEKNWVLGRGVRILASLEVFNLLNDGAYIIFNPTLGYGQNLDGANEATRRFGRQFQLGFRLSF